MRVCTVTSFILGGQVATELKLRNFIREVPLGVNICTAAQACALITIFVPYNMNKYKGGLYERAWPIFVNRCDGCAGVSFLLASSTLLGQSQGPSIEWQKCLGGSLAERARAIQRTSDGGYILAGYTDSKDGDASIENAKDPSLKYRGTELWLVKLDKNGKI